MVIFILRSFRPFLGPASCKFYVSCGDYAILQLQELPLHKALGEITKRLLQCNPLFKETR